MPTINEQLLRLKEYPAKVLMGRATQDGVFLIEDDYTCVDAAMAQRRIAAYEQLNLAHLEYRYEVVPLAEVKKMKAAIRKDLQLEAQKYGLPTRDWYKQ